MTYSVTKQHATEAVFYIGSETGALFVKLGGGMLCIDSSGSSQKVCWSYSLDYEKYEPVLKGSRLVIEVEK